MTRSLSAWLNGLNAVELALLFCGVFVLISFIGIAVLHPSIRRMVHGQRQANDVVIFVAANYGLVYAVLLGLLIVATFQITKDSQDNIAMEAFNLSTIYNTADMYPEPLRSQLRPQLRDYLQYVLKKDWPAQRKLRVLTGGEHRLKTIRKELLSFRPTDKSQEALQSEMMHYFNAMNVSREQRLSAVFPSIPDVLWYVLIIGALVTITFMWMLHMDLVPQLLLSGITAFFLGIMIFLIYAMDHPLQGSVSIAPEPFQTVHDVTMKWDDEFATKTTFVSLGTGELNGIYYPVGSSICDIVNRDANESVRCSVEETPGSVHNVDAIRSGELEFGVVQSDVAYAAYNGVGAFTNQPFRNLRSVLVLYPELVTIIARTDAGIHQIADLAGKRINIGQQGSGTHATWDSLQAAAGWTNAQKPQTTELPTDAAARALCAGRLDANFLVVGHPSPSVRSQLTSCATNFVAVSQPVIDALISRGPYLFKAYISGADYGVTGETPSIGGNAVLMTSASMDPTVVAALSRAVISHSDDLRAKQPALAHVTVEKLTAGNVPVPVPLHPAANDLYNHLRQSVTRNSPRATNPGP